MKQNEMAKDNQGKYIDEVQNTTKPTKDSVNNRNLHFHIFSFSKSFVILKLNGICHQLTRDREDKLSLLTMAKTRMMMKTVLSAFLCK